jgi:hypothetical protein
MMDGNDKVLIREIDAFHIVEILENESIFNLIERIIHVIFIIIILLFFYLTYIHTTIYLKCIAILDKKISYRP